ncbi:MAG: division/cell wall cluster transcriptional repressor MraZ [Oscillospiraceae bacterium]|jgi:MraZ protein|nr:division/cell wall cluster transcriptional repressor MraZ [Oscillospiraceae bacterium]
MTGSFEYKIDAKGRLFIPSSLRGELGEIFHVTISDEDCLNAFSKDSWERILGQNKEMSMRGKRRMRVFFSNAARCELDSQGRFLLPQKLRDRVGLQKNVTVVGAGTFVQLWDTEKFKLIDEEESTPENLADVMDELDF